MSAISDAAFQGEDGFYCRFSDAAFAELVLFTSIGLGKIAKPEDVGDTDVSPAGTPFEITSDAGSFSDGDEIYHIGRTSGWETAEVLETCAFFEISPSPRITRVGQASITAYSDDPAHGDSGAPEVVPQTGNDVNFIGTLFAGDADEDDVFYPSRLGVIYYELSASSVWNSCVSAC